MNSNDNQANAKIQDAESAQLQTTLAGDNEGKAPSARVPHVCFTLRRVRLLDIDAKFGSIKDLLDGLQYAGLIRGDREGEITLDVRQEKVSHYHEEETEIEITL